MAHKCPRFLFSDSRDTKISGPFIVHTEFPQLVAKVSFTEDGGHQVDVSEVFVETGSEQIDNVLYRMYDWYTGVRMRSANLRQDFFIRASDIARQVGAVGYFSKVTVSMVFIPQMGATLYVEKENWNITIHFINGDTFNSVMLRLEAMYIKNHGDEPNWPILYKRN
jgi:hypothetical protein